MARRRLVCRVIRIDVIVRLKANLVFTKTFLDVYFKLNSFSNRVGIFTSWCSLIIVRRRHCCFFNQLQCVHHFLSPVFKAATNCRFAHLSRTWVMLKRQNPIFFYLFRVCCIAMVTSEKFVGNNVHESTDDHFQRDGHDTFKTS